MDTRHHDLCKVNRARLKPIVKIFDFCGNNNIALRGRNDDGPVDLTTLESGEGNFRSLLKTYRPLSSWLFVFVILIFKYEELKEEFMAYIDVLDKEYTTQANVMEDDAFIPKTVIPNMMEDDVLLCDSGEQF